MAGAPHLEAFLDAAKYYQDVSSIESSLGQEMAAEAGFAGYTGAWCAVYVMACAARAGVLGTVIGYDEYAVAPGVALETVDKCDGEFIDGPAINGGVAVTPNPGDIITFAWDSAHVGRGHANHIGIVQYVKDGQVHTLEGNTGGGWAGSRDIDLDDHRINLYVRPDWSKVGDVVANLGKNKPLYKIKNDRHDMTMREVGYLEDYQLTNKETGIHISIINYTTVLGELYDIFAPTAKSEIRVDTSKLTGNTRISMDMLLKLGFSASAASGITAAIYVYSKIDPKFSEKIDDKSYIYGIGGWSGDTLQRLKDRLGIYQWNKNLSGQIQFLADDLTLHYKGLLDVLINADLDSSSAKQCARTFLTQYNSHFNTIGNANAAEKLAMEIFDALVITKIEAVGNIDNLVNSDGETLTAQKSVDIPSYVQQTGILYDADFSSYSQLYHVWGSTTDQRDLAETWVSLGCPCSKGIALVGGYYCVAVKPQFGSVGDVIVVTLEDGTAFAAIIADEKGDDAKSDWGHEKEDLGGISIIEWERIKTDEYGQVVTTEGLRSTDVDYIGYGDGDIQIPEWFKKKVVNITNYGSY